MPASRPRERARAILGRSVPASRSSRRLAVLATSTALTFGALVLLYETAGRAFVERVWADPARRAEPFWEGIMQPDLAITSMRADRVAHALLAAFGALAALALLILALARLRPGWLRGTLLVLVWWLAVETLAGPYLVYTLRLNHFAFVRDPDHRPPGNAAAPGWNSDGLRQDREAEGYRDEDLVILFLGDSFTMGFRLAHPEREAFPALIEQRLGARLAEDLAPGALKVANFGWTSASPLLSARRLADIGAKYRPDLVCLCIDMTDPLDDIWYENLLERRGLTWFFDKLPITIGLLRDHAPGFYRELFALSTGRNQPALRFFHSEQPLELSRPFLEPLAQNVRRTAELARGLGADFCVFVHPRNYQYTDREAPEDRELEKEFSRHAILGPHSAELFHWFEEFAADVDFPVFELLSDFAASDVHPHCYPDDAHWNPAGHGSRPARSRRASSRLCARAWPARARRRRVRSRSSADARAASLGWPEGAPRARMGRVQALSRSRAGRLLLGALAGLVLALAGGCGEGGAPARRVLVVGWDGAGFELVDPLLAAGRLPNLAALAARGVQAELESTVVPISSAAWCAATTGRNPGGSGVYSFFEPVPESYDVELISSRSNRATPVWRTLGRRGLRSVVWGVPVTYPPEPIPGVLVAGMLSPPDGVYTHPPELAARLRARGFVPDLGMWRSDAPITDPAAVEQQIAIKERELCEVLEAEDWSLAWIVFKSLDVLSHAEYDGALDGRVALLLERLDRSLGLLIEAAGSDVDVVVLSDHGFRAYRRAFNVHTWLVENGYALAREEAPAAAGPGPLAEVGAREQRRFLAGLDLARTRAFGTKAEGHFGGLRFNVAGREPEGALAPEDVPAFFAELRRGLLGLRGPGGRAVVREVWSARELYPGPFAEHLPDLLFETDPELLVFSDRAGPLLGPLGRSYPDHARTGIFFAAGPHVKTSSARAAFAIADVAPTVLALLDQSVYTGLDGAVQTGIFKSAPDVRYAAEAEDPPDSAAYLEFRAADETLSSEERAELMARLKQLGYVE